MSNVLTTTRESLEIYYKSIQEQKGKEFTIEKFVNLNFDKFKEDLKRYSGKEIDDKKYSDAVEEVKDYALKNNIVIRKTLSQIEEEIIKPFRKKQNKKADNSSASISRSKELMR